MRGWRGDVEHVNLERVAVAPGGAQARRARGDDLGAGGMVFEAGQRLQRFSRVANDATVRRDERDAGTEQGSHTVGFGVEISGARTVERSPRATQ